MTVFFFFFFLEIHATARRLCFFVSPTPLPPTRLITIIKPISPHYTCMEGQGGGRRGFGLTKEDFQILSCRLGVVWCGLVLVFTIKYKSSPLAHVCLRVLACVCVCVGCLST